MASVDGSPNMAPLKVDWNPAWLICITLPIHHDCLDSNFHVPASCSAFSVFRWRFHAASSNVSSHLSAAMVAGAATSVIYRYPTADHTPGQVWTMSAPYFLHNSLSHITPVSAERGPTRADDN